MTLPAGAKRSAILAGVALGTLFAASTCHRPALTTTPTASRRTNTGSEQPSVNAFDPVAAIRTEGTPIAAVLRTETLDETLTKARALLTRETSADIAGEIRWVAGRRAATAGHWDAAREHLVPLASSEHPLHLWAALMLAEGLVEHAPAEAARLAAQVAAQTWVGRGRARRIEAQALRAAGNLEDALRRYQDLLGDLGEDSADASVLVPIAELLVERARGRRDVNEAREAALRLYRRLLVALPGSDDATLAETRSQELLDALPRRRRRSLERLSPAERLTQGRAWYDSGHYTKAMEQFSVLAEDAGIDNVTRCEARFMQGRVFLRTRKRDEGAQRMDAVTQDECSDALRARAFFNAARAHARRGRAEQALHRYQQVEALSPSSTLADDARFRGALASRELGDEAGFEEALSTLPVRYPEGDMRGEARFRLAWHALGRARRGDERARTLARALEVLGASLADDPLETAEDIRGRTEYWRARAQADLGQREAAIEGFEALCQRFPLSYYGQQALSRLGELDPDRQRAELARLRGPENDRGQRLTFPPDIVSPGLKRAVALLRVGEAALAKRELDRLAHVERTEPETRMLVAALHYANGDYAAASRLARSRLSAFAGDPPTGRARHLWRIAYPLAFAPLIEQVASAEHVPAAFVRAVAREESAFDPEAVSVARAYGLIQLIRPTAQRFARELGLASTPRALKRPEVNLRIGTRFIGFLWRRYTQNTALVPAAYNAGEGASDRWLRERRNEPLDVWIENIPYDETRRYTRRVLQTYGIYSWLDDQELPRLEPRLPPN